jgi:hypothetical protein
MNNDSQITRTSLIPESNPESNPESIPTSSMVSWRAGYYFFMT